MNRKRQHDTEANRALNNPKFWARSEPVEGRKERRKRMREITKELRKAGKRMARKKIREVEGD